MPTPPKPVPSTPQLLKKPILPTVAQPESKPKQPSNSYAQRLDNGFNEIGRHKELINRKLKFYLDPSNSPEHREYAHSYIIIKIEICKDLINRIIEDGILIPFTKQDPRGYEKYRKERSGMNPFDRLSEAKKRFREIEKVIEKVNLTKKGTHSFIKLVPEFAPDYVA
jgi:hypothetical protein